MTQCSDIARRQLCLYHHMPRPNREWGLITYRPGWSALRTPTHRFARSDPLPHLVFASRL